MRRSIAIHAMAMALVVAPVAHADSEASASPEETFVYENEALGLGDLLQPRG
ncbi:hypothetical protein [Novosphingobium rosa]|uniref:hypothetical protein n=1 Tax=Novosphingobium rosa TaxID=76978 RepID=UPI000B1C4A5E|nr:hypothetical protein [Novosphingobium rosa]